MIRSAILLSLFLPALAAANSAPCGASVLVPLPTSVPAPEMLRQAPILASCIDLAAYTRRLTQPVVVAPTPAAAAAPGAYVPKTQHDNTPWRFDMNQNGRRMTAVEFDAWMKAKGIRVATGKPGASTSTAAPAVVPGAAPAVLPAAAATPAAGCVPSATVVC